MVSFGLFLAEFEACVPIKLFIKKNVQQFLSFDLCTGKALLGPLLPGLLFLR